MRVSHEWRRILCSVPHAWGSKLDLRDNWDKTKIYAQVVFNSSKLAWKRVSVSARRFMWLKLKTFSADSCPQSTMRGNNVLFLAFLEPLGSE